MPFALLVRAGPCTSPPATGQNNCASRTAQVCFMQQYEGLTPRRHFRGPPTGQLTFGGYPRLLHMLFHLLPSLVPPRDSTHTLFGAVVIATSSQAVFNAARSLLRTHSQKSSRFPSFPLSFRSCARYSLPMYLHLHLTNVIANVAFAHPAHRCFAIGSQIHLAASR
ncbi:hypothetical protein DFH09DRAFT_1300239 [Mycena vulgaris]|nr:hypothetical protein DFH09DRAFT_1300239 [Mycena vulgaris]